MYMYTNTHTHILLYLPLLVYLYTLISINVSFMAIFDMKNLCFLKHIYPHSSMLFHLNRLFRFIDIILRSTLSSNSCTYTPCSVCARINMYDEIFIHTHPKINIYPFRARLFSNTACVPSCAYMNLIWLVHIYPLLIIYSHTKRCLRCVHIILIDD